MKAKSPSNTFKIINDAAYAEQTSPTPHQGSQKLLGTFKTANDPMYFIIHFGYIYE